MWWTSSPYSGLIYRVHPSKVENRRIRRAHKVNEVGKRNSSKATVWNQWVCHGSSIFSMGSGWSDLSWTSEECNTGSDHGQHHNSSSSRRFSFMLLGLALSHHDVGKVNAPLFTYKTILFGDWCHWPDVLLGIEHWHCCWYKHHHIGWSLCWLLGTYGSLFPHKDRWFESILHNLMCYLRLWKWTSSKDFDWNGSCSFQWWFQYAAGNFNACKLQVLCLHQFLQGLLNSQFQ